MKNDLYCGLTLLGAGAVGCSMMPSYGRVGETVLFVVVAVVGLRLIGCWWWKFQE